VYVFLLEANLGAKPSSSSRLALAHLTRTSMTTTTGRFVLLAAAYRYGTTKLHFRLPPGQNDERPFQDAQLCSFFLEVIFLFSLLLLNVCPGCSFVLTRHEKRNMGQAHSTLLSTTVTMLRLLLRRHVESFCRGNEQTFSAPLFLVYLNGCIQDAWCPFTSYPVTMRDILKRLGSFHNI
jgi:hypothetical protein